MKRKDKPLGHFGAAIRKVNPLAFPPKQRVHLVINLLVGVFVAVILHGVETVPFGQAAMDQFADEFIRSEFRPTLCRRGDSECEELLAKTVGKSRVFFWEVDDAAAKEGHMTSRRSVLNALRAATDASPRVVLVDYDFAERSTDAAADQALTHFLRSYPRDGGSPDIILSMRSSRDRVLKPFFTREIAGHPKIHLASAMVLYSDIDGAARYWSMYVEHGEQFYWNAAYLAFLLSSGATAQEIKAQRAALREAQETSHPVQAMVGGNAYWFAPPEAAFQYQRSRFLLAPAFEGSATNLDYTNRLNSASLSGAGEDMKDKVVVIGNAEPASGDIHRTPIGDLPGMYVLGNAIHTLQAGLRISPPPKSVALLVEAVVILLSAYAFLYFRSFTASVLMVGVSLALFLPVGRFLFLHFGLLLNVGFIVVGMGLHKLVADFEDLLHERSLLRDHHEG